MYHFVLLLCIAVVYGDHHARTNQLPDRSTIVHLFEWKWKDIADECERFLAPHGFGGVQISPPSENLIIHLPDGSRTWYERYQVMSYKLTTRSGDENDFLDMTTRCNKVGVRIYADVVVNHMTGDNPNNVGTAGSTANFKEYDYPGVPYTQEHFHYPYCGVNNYNNATETFQPGYTDRGHWMTDAAVLVLRRRGDIFIHRHITSHPTTVTHYTNCVLITYDNQ